MKPEEKVCGSVNSPIKIDVIPDEKSKPVYPHIDTSPEKHRHEPKRFRKDAVNSPSGNGDKDVKSNMRAMLGLSSNVYTGTSDNGSSEAHSSSTPASSPSNRPVPRLSSVMDANEISAINCMDKVENNAEQNDVALLPIVSKAEKSPDLNDLSIIAISEASLTPSTGKYPTTVKPTPKNKKNPKNKQRNKKQKVVPTPMHVDELDSSDSDDIIEILENPRKEFQINQSISEEFRRAGKTEEEIAVGIFWDIENVRMPRGLNPAIFITKIREKFVDESPNFCEKHFYVVCDTGDWPPILMKQLFEFHVRIIHVPRLKANSSDNVLRDLMHEFVNYNKFARLILISGDSDFSHDIHNFRRNKKFDCILIHNQQSKESMKRSATSAYLYSDLIKQELIDHNINCNGGEDNNYQRNVRPRTHNNYGSQPNPTNSVNYFPDYPANQRRVTYATYNQLPNARLRNPPKQKRFYNHDFGVQQQGTSSEIPAPCSSTNSSGGSGVLPEFIPVNTGATALTKAYYRKKRKQMITPKKGSSKKRF